MNEKIDHHFNELSPVDFNIFAGASLYQKLQKENLTNQLTIALHDHITVIKDQVESLLNGEDEQLTTVYGFLSTEEQEDYLSFLKMIEKDTQKYLSRK